MDSEAHQKMQALKAVLAGTAGAEHYKKLAIHPIEYAILNGLTAAEFSVVKYVTRHRSKGGAVDIRKAKDFLDMILATEYPEIPD